jgi:hypothetical protein
MSGLRIVACAALLAARLAAQAPAARTRSFLPPPKAAPVKTINWLTVTAAAAGATTGALIGARGLSFAAVAPADRTAHAWRAGATYGVIGGVLGAALAERAQGPGPAMPHRFWLDRWTTPLIAGIGAVQVLDYTSTRYFRDRGKDEWLLTNSLVDKRGAFVATEVSAAAAGVSLMYLFHRAGHHKLERWAAAAYVAFGVLSAVANYRYPATGHALF